MRKTWRFLRKRKNRPIIITTLAMVTLLVLLNPVKLFMPPRVNPTAYQPLLNTIAQGESNGNYNAYYGNAHNTDIHFTDMTIAQVLDWQRQYVASGSPSSAVGRYQIIHPTMLGLVAQLQLDTTAKFDASMQDRLAITLMERRGSVAFVYKKLTEQEFAANLAKEWASLPRMTGPDPGKSYYTDDGLNTARVSIPAVTTAVRQLQLHK
ncbi:MAG TPA: hypothetical protein VLF59_05290 [Candidatus Saccharimonadales bacterium]|nr:hypothetical protein [Candidatus Saccharimonadales bacterium]